MPMDGTLVQQSVFGLEFVMNDVEKASIAIHLSLSPRRTTLFHLHTPMNCENWTEHVETPTGECHFVDLDRKSQ